MKTWFAQWTVKLGLSGKIIQHISCCLRACIPYFFIQFFLKRKATQFASQVENYQDAQYKCWKKVVDQGKKTAYGKDHGFSEICTIDEYQQKVPIVQYEHMLSYVEQELNGNTQSLISGELSAIAVSSGTTSGRKRFPISFDSIHNHLLAGADYFSFHIAAQSKSLRKLLINKGKSVVFPGTCFVNKDGVLEEDMSAISAVYLPLFAKKDRLPLQDLVMKSLPRDEKISQTLDQCIDEKYVWHLAGNPQNIIDFLKQAELRSPQKPLKELWPYLSLVSFGGANPFPYQPELEEIFKRNDISDVEFRSVYNATEGFLGAQFSAEDQLVLFANHGMFFEFIALEDAKNISINPHPKAYTLADVAISKIDTPLAVVLSIDGMYRYLIGDVGRFIFDTNSIQSFQCPYGYFELLGRVTGSLNIVGEEVMESHVMEVMKSLCATYPLLSSSQFMGTAERVKVDDDEYNIHLWFIESEESTQSDSWDKMGKEFDIRLQEYGRDYQTKRSRKYITIAPLVFFLPVGGLQRMFDTVCPNRSAQGNKIVRLKVGTFAQFFQPCFEDVENKQLLQKQINAMSDKQKAVIQNLLSIAK